MSRPIDDTGYGALRVGRTMIRATMPYEQAEWCSALRAGRGYIGSCGCLKAGPCSGSLMSTDCLRATKAGMRVVPRGSVKNAK